MAQPASLRTWAIWLSSFVALLVALREQIPPSTAVSLVMCIPTWILTEGFAESLTRLSNLGGRWALVEVVRPIVLMLAPIVIAIGLCSAPGLTDWVSSDMLGYEGRKWTSGPGQGIGVGLTTLGLHGLGLGKAVAAMLRRKIASQMVTEDLPK